MEIFRMHKYSQLPPLTSKRGIPPMESTPVLLLILFTVISGGIYIPFWFLNRKSIINKLNSEKGLNDNTFVFLGVGFVLNLILLITSSVVNKMALEMGTEEAMGSASIFQTVTIAVSVILGIIVWVQSFRVLSIFRDHFRRRVQFSGFATLLFTIFYLQYKINRIAELRV